VAACGSGSANSGYHPLSQCETKRENAAAADVLRKAYERGKLGGPKQLAAHFKGDARSSYLDESGHLRPYTRITDSQTRFDLEAWMGAVEGNSGPVGDEMFAARMHARRTSTCKSLTR